MLHFKCCYNDVKQYVIEEVILGVVCPLLVVHVVIIYNGKGRLERAKL